MGKICRMGKIWKWSIYLGIVMADRMPLLHDRLLTSVFC